MSARSAEAAFADARSVADAVLFEGYVLYPYRASAQKNRARWQFGMLAPAAWSAAHPDETATMHVDTLLDQAGDGFLSCQLRFLQAQTRRVQVRDGADWRDVPRLDVGEDVLLPWDEAVERQLDVSSPLGQLPACWELDVDAGSEAEHFGADARLLRERRALSYRVTLTAAPLPGPYGALRLSLTVTNTTRGEPAAAGRDTALRDGLLATHALLHVDRGRFLSLADPPEWARPAAEQCAHAGWWPVLVAPDCATLLISPIILDDHPQIAPESPTPLYDGTEIDEILTLRTMALTDEEKREARATDPRAAAVIDQVDSLPPEVLDRLHGTIRYLEEMERGVDPETDTALVAGVPVGRGSKVRLRPAVGGADAQDLFLVGRFATVAGVHRDFDGGTHLSVTVDGDPLAELQLEHGRYRYFRLDEVEPVGAAQ